MHIRGEFDVKMSPMPPDDKDNPGPLGRMSIDKQFRGDLTATSKGQMVAFRSAVDGSAGYVAMEQVTGTLEGQAGTFVLQHSSTMARGTPRQSITVVPDSGTGELVGLSGTMTIDIVDKKHFYNFDYEMQPSA
jgi:hypothetical protein